MLCYINMEPCLPEFPVGSAWSKPCSCMFFCLSFLPWLTSDILSPTAKLLTQAWFSFSRMAHQSPLYLVLCVCVSCSLCPTFETPRTVTSSLLCPWNSPARVLEWVAILPSGHLPDSRDEPRSPVKYAGRSYTNFYQAFPGISFPSIVWPSSLGSCISIQHFDKCLLIYFYFSPNTFN